MAQAGCSQKLTHQDAGAESDVDDFPLCIYARCVVVG